MNKEKSETIFFNSQSCLEHSLATRLIFYYSKKDCDVKELHLEARKPLAWSTMQC